MPDSLPKGGRDSASSILLLVGPFLFFATIFWVFPLVGGIELALEKSPQVSTSPLAHDRFSTFENFTRALGDSKFLHSIENTALFVSGSIVTTLVLAFLLACIILDLPAKIRGVFLFFLLVPSLAMPGTLATLFYLFFHGKSGALNQFLIIPLGFEPVNWMMDPAWILPCLILQAVWRWTGLVTLLLYCGMKAIPAWQFEVARIEGAGTWDRVRTILYPGVRHLLIFGGVFLFVDGVAAFSGAYNLLGGSGGVLDAGLLFVTYAYQVAFPGGGGRFDLPLASAMCLLVAGSTAFLGCLFLKFCKHERGGW